VRSTKPKKPISILIGGTAKALRANAEICRFLRQA
jgi:hypothetical protein